MELLVEEPNFSLELSLGHACLAGDIDAAQVIEFMDAYYGALDSE